MEDHARLFDTTPNGLSDLTYPHIEALGHRGSRIVYHAPELVTVRDPSSSLIMFKIASVFGDTNAVLLGCGTPNFATTVFDDATRTWQKLNAFMFYREESYVADTKGDLQAGVYFELRGLSADVRVRLFNAMKAHGNRRVPSCARLNANVLADVGFTLGNGHNLRRVLRPSKLAGLIWSHGLKLDGEAVEMRIVNTSKLETGDHFVGVWRKEANSPLRLIKKLVKKRQQKRERVAVPGQRTELRESAWSGLPVTVWMNRPTKVGIWLAFLWGRHAEYKVAIPGFGTSPYLSEPLVAFPGQLSKVSKLKKYVLFSRPVVSGINRVKNKGYDRYDNVPIDAALEMMSPVASPDSDVHADNRVIWNFAFVRDEHGCEIRMTPLKNQDPLSRSSKARALSNWILAKHVVACGYHPQTLFAGEGWVYRSGDRAKLTLCLNDNSGTYKPTASQLEAFGKLVEGLGLDVRVYPRAG